MLQLRIMSSVFFGVSTMSALVVRYIQRRNVFQAKSAIFSGISDLRKEYSRQGLIEGDIPLEPFSLFKTWFKEACEANVLEPNAMCLSTCTDNKPSARYVLLKDFDENGFVWYTNYNSRKSNELKENPNACLTFWYGDLERQIRIEGTVYKVSDEESTNYFNSRPRGSQIGAWSSSQSQPIISRQALDTQEATTKAKFDDESTTIPRPEHWGGFRLKPHSIEFWKGRASRMHDRLLYELNNHDDTKIEKSMSNSNNWRRTRLQP